MTVAAPRSQDRRLPRWGIVLAAVVVAAVVTHPLHAAVDQREMRAREAFAVGRYQDALELFGKLYAEKLHPNYLRNIGRCYQNLGEPDKAITSFRDYLRKAKNVPAEERAEVEGYVKEMEELKLKRETAAAQAAASAPAPTASAGGPASATTSAPTSATTSMSSATAPATNPTTVSTGGNGPVGASASPGAQLGIDAQSAAAANAGPAAPRDDGAAIYSRWWFWAIIGGVVAAGLGTAAGLGAFTNTEDARCPEGVRC